MGSSGPCAVTCPLATLPYFGSKPVRLRIDSIPYGRRARTSCQGSASSSATSGSIRGFGSSATSRPITAASTASFAARDRHHWMRGLTMRSTPISFRHAVRPCPAQRHRCRQQRHRAALAATGRPKTRSTVSRPSNAQCTVGQVLNCREHECCLDSKSTRVRNALPEPTISFVRLAAGIPGVAVCKLRRDVARQQLFL